MKPGAYVDPDYALDLLRETKEEYERTLAQAWRMLERGASREQVIELIANALGVNEVDDDTKSCCD